MQAVLQPETFATEQLAQFDRYGRCLPFNVAAAVHVSTRRYFQCHQPEIDYASIHERSRRYLGELEVSANEFRARAESIMRRLADDPTTSPMTRGVAVPFVLPRADFADLGAALESHFLPGIAKAFTERFPEYSFVDHHYGNLSGVLQVAAGSRHQQLIEAMGQADVVGYYFPALSEYSIPAAIERLAGLPDDFLLAGGFDTVAALVGCPDLLLRTDGYPPLLWLAALMGERADAGYYFEAYGYNLTFNSRPHFNQAAEYWASGLVVIG